MNLTDYGFRGVRPSRGTPARITAVHKERFAIVSEFGEGYARLKGSAYYDGGQSLPTVGDFVVIDHVPDGDSRIAATLPRTSLFSRRDPDPSRGAQAVAANFDCVFILQSLNQDFNTNRLERYAALAWESGASPVVVLTKLDLAGESASRIQLAQAAVPGVPVLALSARTGEGLGQLDKFLQPGKTLVLLGSSGVGKSSLVNALAGFPQMSTGSIRDDDGKGRHTTTHRQLLRLPSGAMIIDTPGMRELGMWAVDDGLDAAFPEIEALLGCCRFRDCTHRTEPGCAIRAAIEKGSIREDRFLRYQQLRQEAQAADTKAAILRRKADFFRSIDRAKKHKHKEIW